MSCCFSVYSSQLDLSGKRGVSKRKGRFQQRLLFNLNKGLRVGRDFTVGLDVVEVGVGGQSLDAVVGKLCSEAEECRGVSLGDLSSCVL